MKSLWFFFRLFCLASFIIPTGSRALEVTLSPHACKPRGSFHCFTVEASQRPPDSGRSASFEVLSAPAKTKTKALPIFVVEALGEAGSEAATEGLLHSLTPLNETHDLVFVDQRGVSGKLSLLCSSVRPAATLATFSHSLYDTRVMRSCADLWKSKIDLSTLNARTFAADLEAVREGLGYERIELIGYFYGTRIIEEYVRRFGVHAAAALLIDVAVPGVSIVATQLPAQDRALDRAEQECLADANCRTQYPQLADEYARLKTRIAAGSPFSADIKDDGTSEQVLLTADVVRSWLGGMALRINTAPTVPPAIHTLMSADISPIARSILTSRRAVWQGLPLGEIVSVRCNEGDLPLNQDRGAARELVAACGVWPHTHVPSDFTAPLESTVPILGVTPEESATAPVEAVRVLFAALPNARLVVLPRRSRAADYDWDICLKPISVAFLDGMNPQTVDARCAEELQGPDFSGTAGQTSG